MSSVLLLSSTDTSGFIPSRQFPELICCWKSRPSFPTETTFSGHKVWLVLNTFYPKGRQDSPVNNNSIRSSELEVWRRITIKGLGGAATHQRLFCFNPTKWHKFRLWSITQ